MNVFETSIPGVVVFEPRVFEDARGLFFESYNVERYRAAGIVETFVQDNVSFSRRGVLRGLHFQNPSAQGKLVQVLSGEVFDVAADIRRGSPTFGHWVAQSLSSENARQMYIPAGFAHGFVVVSNEALFLYKCTAYYHQPAEHTIRWDDPTIRITWPVIDPILSPRDALGRFLSDFPEDALPAFAE